MVRILARSPLGTREKLMVRGDVTSLQETPSRLDFEVGI